MQMAKSDSNCPGNLMLFLSTWGDAPDWTGNQNGR